MMEVDCLAGKCGFAGDQQLRGDIADIGAKHTALVIPLYPT